MIIQTVGWRIDGWHESTGIKYRGSSNEASEREGDLSAKENIKGKRKS